MDPPSKRRKPETQSSSFCFAFDAEEGASLDETASSTAVELSDAAAAEPLPPEERRINLALVKENYYAPGGMMLCQGRIVRIDWENCEHPFSLLVRDNSAPHSALGFISPQLLQPLWLTSRSSSRSASTSCSASNCSASASAAPAAAAPATPNTTARTAPLVSCDRCFFYVYDSVFLPEQPPLCLSCGSSLLPAAPSFRPHLSPVPLLLEPGLDSIAWPLSPSAFTETVFKRCRALVVLGTGQRLSELRKDFLGLDIQKLLESASRIVVWMKTLKGQMQFIEASPVVALSCYKAGHSLYFNPSSELQERFISAITSDLGLDFGTLGENGDVELFAVSGSHDTPWHFDAQDNFTIQLRGVKRWSILPPPEGLEHPITNLHPQNSDQAQLLKDRVKLSMCCPCRPVPPPPGPEHTAAARANSVLLRPGSVLFVPAGSWHRVEAVDDAEGSLSVNLSLHPARWLDVLLSRLAPWLWSCQQGRWREFVHAGTREQMLAQLDELLKGMSKEIGKLRAADFLASALVEEKSHHANGTAVARKASARVIGSGETDQGTSARNGKQTDSNATLPGQEDSFPLFYRNPFAVMVSVGEHTYKVCIGQKKIISQRTLKVAAELEPWLAWLASRPGHVCTSFQELVQCVEASTAIPTQLRPLLKNLVDTLMHEGFLVLQQEK
eukprot:g23420.t1